MVCAVFASNGNVRKGECWRSFEFEEAAAVEVAKTRVAVVEEVLMSQRFVLQIEKLRATDQAICSNLLQTENKFQRKFYSER